MGTVHCGLDESMAYLVFYMSSSDSFQGPPGRAGLNGADGVAGPPGNVILIPVTTLFLSCPRPRKLKSCCYGSHLVLINLRGAAGRIQIL